MLLVTAIGISLCLVLCLLPLPLFYVLLVSFGGDPRSLKLAVSDSFVRQLPVPTR